MLFVFLGERERKGGCLVLYGKKYKKNTKLEKKSLQSGKTSIILTSAVT